VSEAISPGHGHKKLFEPVFIIKILHETIPCVTLLKSKRRRKYK
jgi:hypothetical protein